MPLCYNGIIDEHETCDFGVEILGCLLCNTEVGWSCNSSGCKEICGDNLIVGDEVCDNGC